MAQMPEITHPELSGTDLPTCSLYRCGREDTGAERGVASLGGGGRLQTRVCEARQLQPAPGAGPEAWGDWRRQCGDGARATSNFPTLSPSNTGFRGPSQAPRS